MPNVKISAKGYEISPKTGHSVFSIAFKKKRWVTLTDQFQLVHQYSMANLNTIGAKNKKFHQREDYKPANTDIYFLFSSNLEFLFQGLC